MTADFRTLIVADALLGADYRPAGPTRIEIKDGVISAIESLAAATGTSLLAMPAIMNAHDHARPLSSTSFGAGGKPLESWLPRLAVMASVDPYLAAAAPLARAARGGCAGVMVHLTRPMGLTPLAEEARTIARAAADVGVSVALAISMKDVNPLVYGDHADLVNALPEEARLAVKETYFANRPAPASAQVALVDSVAEALSGTAVDLQYGPNGVQWCSQPLLEGIAEASAATGRRVHMHLLETCYQRQWADANFPDGIVQHLADIGLLSPRLTLAHCVWARPDEMEIIAEHGARISVNPSSNLHLKSGVAQAAEMLRHGVRVGMGIDGCALDEDDDGLRELRLFRLLNAGTGFEQGVAVADALRAACGTGRAALGLEGEGTIAVGQPADLLLLDLDRLDRDRIMDVDPRDYLFTRARAEDIAEVIARGRTIVRDGHVTGIDLAEVESNLRAAYRELAIESEQLRQAWPDIESGIRDFYHAQLGCC